MYQVPGRFLSSPWVLSTAVVPRNRRFYPQSSSGQAVATGVSFLPPRGTCLHVLPRIGFRIPSVRRCSSNVANSRPRAFRKSTLYAQERVDTNKHAFDLSFSLVVPFIYPV